MGRFGSGCSAEFDNCAFQLGGACYDACKALDGRPVLLHRALIAEKDPNDRLLRRGSAVPFIGDLCSAASLLMLVLLSELLAVAYTVLITGVADFDFLTLAYASLFLLWASLGGAALLCRLRPLLARLSMGASAGCSFAVCLVWVGLLGLFSQYLAAATAGRELDWRWLLDTLVVACIVIGIGLRYAYLSHQLRLRQQSALNAELDALQARIRPHFLFNTLNSISSLIASDSEKAEQAVADLATLFRANLGNAARMVSWSEEKALCESYLRIERLRLGSRLQVDWREHGDVSGAQVPSLILQPLLENAIVHGIQVLPEGGALTIDVAENAGQLVIRVRNPLPDQAGGGGSGIATDNIVMRLQALYGGQASLAEQIGSAEAEYVACLRLPTRWWGGAA
jgi:two-component system, LytTR family, sensor histidine kinase AlgZ